MRAPILPPPPPRRRKRKRSKSMLLGFLGFSFAAGMLLFLAASGVAGYLLWNASKDLPSYEKLAEYEPPVMTRIHAHDGSLIAEYARERRIFVPIHTIPPLVKGAFLSAEDKRFYEHGGLDFVGIGRALIKFIQNPNARAEGASTITQQVAKNFLLTNERKLERKLKEAILAIRIERAYSKDKILELYLNEIYFGIGSYGIAAAALNYFNKELKDLTPEEAAFLAALPKAPSNYHPFRNTAAATERRNWILGEMAANGYITREQAQAARAKPLQVNIRGFGAHIFAAEYFAEEVRRRVLNDYGEDKLYGGGLSVRTTLDPELQKLARKALADGLVDFDRSRGWRGAVQHLDVGGDWGAKLGAIDVATDIAPWRLGIVLEVQKTKILVGLRPGKQPNGQLVAEREAAEVSFDEMKWAGKFVATDRSRGAAPKQPGDVVTVGDVIWVSPKDPANTAGPWTLQQVPDVGGGLVAMDPHTGRILAVAGGFSFDISQFDRALQAKRQPGSSFKPLVYAAAIDNGYKPSSIVLDAPIEIDQGPGKDIWRPENYNKEKSFGPATLRTGLEKSRNQMTVRLAQDMGMPLIVEYAKRFSVYDDLLPVLAMSLGAGETTLVRMVTAYSMIANGGKQVKATLIDRIQDRWGRTVWRHDDRRCDQCKAEQWANQPEPDIADDRRQIMDPHTAYQMTSMMEGVIQRGTGTVVKKFLPGVPVAGKTGTTNESKDTWFIGFVPDMVVGVYIGYDNPRPMGSSATGGNVSAPIFGAFMKAALAGKKPSIFRRPPGIKEVWVSSRTGLRANRGDTDAIPEYFKPFEEPDDPNSFLGYQTSSDSYGDAPPAPAYSSGPGRPSAIGPSAVRPPPPRGYDSDWPPRFPSRSSTY
jgi:penicillin-binding protein 1A